MNSGTERNPNPHEAPLGKFLRGLALPISGPGYMLAPDGSIRRAGGERTIRKAGQRARRAKVIKAPLEPRRSWADIQAAWRKRRRFEDQFLGSIASAILARGEGKP